MPISFSSRGIAPQCANIVTDFGASGDGSTLEDTAFVNYRTKARLQRGSQHCLVLPSLPPRGRYKLVISGGAGFIPFDGIANFTLHGQGSELSSCRPTCTCGPTGGGWTDAFALINDLPLGATSLTLITPSDASFFTVGEWIELDGYEMQSAGGYPPSHQYMQFVQITGIAGSTITFTPATTNHYKTTWPSTSIGDYYTGGPAAIHRMVPAGGSDPKGWETDVVIENTIFRNYEGNPGSQCYTNGRSVHYINCSFVDCAPVPTFCKHFLATNCTVPGTNEVETDKDCELVEWESCNIGNLSHQSSSIMQTNIRDSSLDVLGGTPRSILIEDTTIRQRMSIGASGYGYTETVVMNRVQCPQLNVRVSNKLPIASFTKVGSTLTWNGLEDQIIRFAVPGAKYYFATGGGAGEYSNPGKPFYITDVYRSGGLITMDTTLDAVTPSGLAVHDYYTMAPCGSLSATDCGGGDDIRNACLSSDVMPFTHSRIRGDFTTLLGEHFMYASGLLVSLVVDVIQAYTGGQTTSLMQMISPFGPRPVVNTTTWDETTDTWQGLINLKIAGTRTFTPSSSTGMQSGDEIRRNGSIVGAFGDLWNTTIIVPTNGTDMSADTEAQKPIVQIDFQTTWGI